MIEHRFPGNNMELRVVSVDHPIPGTPLVRTELMRTHRPVGRVLVRASEVPKRIEHPELIFRNTQRILGTILGDPDIAFDGNFRGEVHKHIPEVVKAIQRPTNPPSTIDAIAALVIFDAAGLQPASGQIGSFKCHIAAMEAETTREESEYDYRASHRWDDEVNLYMQAGVYYLNNQQELPAQSLAA